MHWNNTLKSVNRKSIYDLYFSFKRAKQPWLTLNQSQQLQKLLCCICKRLEKHYKYRILHLLAKCREHLLPLPDKQDSRRALKIWEKTHRLILIPTRHYSSSLNRFYETICLIILLWLSIQQIKYIKNCQKCTAINTEQARKAFGVRNIY